MKSWSFQPTQWLSSAELRVKLASAIRWGSMGRGRWVEEREVSKGGAKGGRKRGRWNGY